MAKEDGAINPSDNSDRTGRKVGGDIVGNKSDANIGGTQGPTNTDRGNPEKLMRDAIKRVGDNYPHNKGD